MSVKLPKMFKHTKTEYTICKRNVLSTKQTTYVNVGELYISIKIISTLP